MPDCLNLVHPFQNDSGTSQRQRIMDELLSGEAKIDARTLADLLNFFVQFSRHINYYDRNLNISDWQPFFKKSLPFTISSIMKYDAASIGENFELYNALFNKRPSVAGLQLTFYFIYYKTLRQLSDWYVAVKDSNLPIENILTKLIRDDLADPIKNFIYLMNAASKCYCVKRISFTTLFNNEEWASDTEDEPSDIESYFTDKALNKTEGLIELQKAVKELFPSFLEAIRTVSIALETDESLQQALLPMKEELQKNHHPHLSLLFAFLKMFQKLQQDLNGFNKKHLDFFYTDVLKLKPRDAVPDRAHIIFELQNQLKKYALKKGLLVKDGKDEKKEEILFALDDEIIVNKTQVAEVRTLFVNNQVLQNNVYVEGVYMAPKANMADGIEKDFNDPGPKNYPALGAKYSKYIEPEKTDYKPYPFARIGFILASPVLLLNEGSRTVDITLACKFTNNCELNAAKTEKKKAMCCDEREIQENAEDKCHEPPSYLAPDKLYDSVKKMLHSRFFVITEDMIKEVINKGVSETVGQKIRNRFLIDYCQTSHCCARHKNYKQRTSVKSKYWNKFLKSTILTDGEQEILKETFKEKSPFKILFSGEKEWIESSETPVIQITGDATKFTLQIKALLKADKPAVTFYDKEKLKEDFNTKQPLVKIELDGDINLVLNKNLRKRLGIQREKGLCCLDIDVRSCASEISLYYFLRNYNLDKGTKIDVTVCGLKNFVVQNDEGVQDVNGPFPAFGSRPNIGSNFYLGSEEIFLKKWTGIWISKNWKDLPTFSPPLPDQLHDKPFQFYYNGTRFFLNPPADPTQRNFVEDDKFKVQFSLLFDGVWYESSIPDCNTTNNNDLLFQASPIIPPIPPNCNISAYTHQFHVVPATFINLPFEHVDEVSFKGLKKLDSNTGIPS